MYSILVQYVNVWLCSISKESLLNECTIFCKCITRYLFTRSTPSSTPVHDLLTKRLGFSRRKFQVFIWPTKLVTFLNFQCSHTCMSVRMVCIEPVYTYSSFHVKTMILDDLGDESNIYFPLSVIITYHLFTFRFMACERDCWVSQ